MWTFLVLKVAWFFPPFPPIRPARYSKSKILYNFFFKYKNMRCSLQPIIFYVSYVFNFFQRVGGWSRYLQMVSHILSISLSHFFTALLQITTFENATMIRINNKYWKLQQCNKGVNSKECGTIVALLRCCQCSGAFYSHHYGIAH
jgi:hypothetical protein